MEPEFAPEYSSKERLHKFAVVAPLVLGLYAAVEWWFLPVIRRFSDNAYCETVLGVPGQVVLFYGLFIGIPMLSGLLVCAMTINCSLKAIRARRYPPPGEKVFRRTKVKTGWSAVAIACGPIVITILLFCLACWGYGAATELIEKSYKIHPRGWNCPVQLQVSHNTAVNQLPTAATWLLQC